MNLDHFRSTYGLDASVPIFPYGSRVYGTQSEKSDYDYMAVVPDNAVVKTGTEYKHNDINVHIYTRKDWQDQLDRHKVHTLEALFLPDGECKKRFRWKLDLGRLRAELSEKASHSFVKAKKKIDVEKDFYVGWKSLFHSVRILTFGIQIAKCGKIADYGAANHHWFEILHDPQYQWDFYKQKYQPIYNTLATEFRKVAPK